MARLILLVDDSEADCNLVTMALEGSHSETQLVVVSDGEQALTYLNDAASRATSSIPDLVILDWNLPRKNGREVLEGMRSSPTLKKVPVVFFTGGRFSPEMKTVCKQHLVFCATKPPELERFFEVVQIIDGYVAKAAGFPDEKSTCLQQLKELANAA